MRDHTVHWHPKPLISKVYIYLFFSISFPHPSFHAQTQLCQDILDVLEQHTASKPASRMTIAGGTSSKKHRWMSTVALLSFAPLVVESCSVGIKDGAVDCIVLDATDTFAVAVSDCRGFTLSNEICVSIGSN